MKFSRCDALALACCAFYLLLGSAWITWPGLQADEVLFAQPLFDPGATAESISIFHHMVPLMLMSYLGCLKTLLYAPLFALFGTGAAVVRLPMITAGALTIWIIYRIVAKVHSERAGAIVAVLLSTDTLYLWLSRCDWGPVTLQHLLAAGAVWMLLRFRTHPQRAAWLAGGFFLFGLALWDKTVFLWPAAGLLTGAALLGREIRPLFTARRVALALVFFALGAFPWIRYNVRQHGNTFSETGHFTTEDSWRKAENLVKDLNGDSLLGYMIRERGPEGQPVDAAASAAISTARALGFPRQSITGWLFLACLAASAFLGRAPRIAALMLAAAFLLMALTRGGGMWSYHAVVLWPLPQLVIAFALVRLPKALLVATLAVTALAALAVTNTHFALLHLYGGSPIWSDAVYDLPAALGPLATKEMPIQVLDWGILEPMQLLSQGKLPIQSAIDRKAITPGAIYVGHLPGAEALPDSNTRLAEDARLAGCTLRVLKIVSDRHGTPVYQLQRCD